MTTNTATPLPAAFSPIVLQAEGLCFGYPQRELFNGLCVRIPPGVTLVRGGDGVGKTTLLRLLAGVVPPRAGALWINGVALSAQPAGFRQQVFWADPRSDVHDLLTPAHWFKTLPRRFPAFDGQVLDALVDGFGLTPHVDKPLYMLSTGSKRKVWLAAGFASGATLTLLDEPFAALDKASIDLVLDCLHEAAGHPSRAWVVAGYEAPGDVPLAGVIDLGN